MEDSLSVKSNESIATSEEFDFITDKPGVSKTPTLNLNNLDLNELQSALSEVLEESHIIDKNDKKMQYEVDKNCSKKIGQSIFYSGIVQPGDDPLSSNLNNNQTILTPSTVSSPPISTSPSSSSSSSPQDEKGDVPKSEFYDCVEEVSDVDQDCTIFSGVTYLGAANINAPKSETEIQRNMAILNEQSIEQGIKVSVSVPSSSQGFVVLYDASSHSVIARYEIHRILFYARGGIDTQEAGCFAFTWSHGDTQESAIFQCHIFRCDISEAVTRVSTCFAKAFQRVPRSISSSITSSIDMAGSVTTIPDSRTLMYVFEVNVEIKEDDGKGVFSTVGRDKNGFRLKTNLEKQLCLTIKQVSDNGPQLTIERCFGVLIAPGRHVKHSDMQLLEMKEQMLSNNQSIEPNCTTIAATWDPTEPSFDALNQETPKDIKQYMTIAVDLVIRGIQEPVRFQMETLVRIINLNERNFWYFQKRSLIQQFFLNLKENFTDDLDVYYDVLNIETLGEIDRNLLNLNLKLPNLISSPSITSIDTNLSSLSTISSTTTTNITTPKDEYNSDGDEPLLSGTGLVSKDCSVDVLESWADVLNRWKQTKQPPKQLNSLVRMGIPEALRGEVWQRLVGVEENAETMETYRVLITKECSCENVIQRDIARTFPAHNFFKEAGGLGQDSLYRVSKAYAVYDSEIGYCQGLSFLAATLLLHMPEEQAFCVLVKLMYDYRLRDLYKDGFDNLYLRLYQLNRLMEEHLPALWQHFKAHHVETHMFASQWFLTLFTARFPLYFVFHIIDVFLLQGIDTLFQIALALLMFCKKDLLLLDFEGILKYFRVSLPKKCRTEEAAKQLVKLACNIKVKKLKKYESDFIALKDGWEIIISDSEAADNVDAETDELQQMRIALTKSEEERIVMIDRINQLKKEVDQAEAEKRNSQTIINDYKLVKQRLETQLQIVKMELDNLKQKVGNCEKCSHILNEKDVDLPQVSMKTDDNNDLERVRELELELAQTKLAHVEAECRNQDLIHQLRNTEYELNTAKNSWPPWLSKTLSSIKEVANKKDFANFTTLQSSNNSGGPSFVSHINAIRRESVPLENSSNTTKEQKRDSLNSIIKDSQSCSNLKTQY